MPPTANVSAPWARTTSNAVGELLREQVRHEHNTRTAWTPARPRMELPVRTLFWLRVDIADLDTVGHTLAGHDEVAFAAASTGAADIFARVSTRDLTALCRYLTTAIAAVPGAGQVGTAPVLRQVKAAVTHYRSAARLPRRHPVDRVEFPNTRGPKPSLHQPGHR